MEKKSCQLSFETVELQVVRMQEAGYSLTNSNEIAKHFEDIMSFIENCGWNLDDYTARLMGWNQGN